MNNKTHFKWKVHDILDKTLPDTYKAIYAKVTSSVMTFYSKNHQQLKTNTLTNGVWDLYWLLCLYRWISVHCWYLYTILKVEIVFFRSQLSIYCWTAQTILGSSSLSGIRLPNFIQSVWPTNLMKSGLIDPPKIFR